MFFQWSCFYAVAWGDHWIQVLMLVLLSEFSCGHCSIVPGAPGTCGVRREHVEWEARSRCSGELGTGGARGPHGTSVKPVGTSCRGGKLRSSLGSERETRSLRTLIFSVLWQNGRSKRFLCLERVREMVRGSDTMEETWKEEPPRLPAGSLASASAHLVTQGVGVVQVYRAVSSGCWPSHWLVAWGPPLLLAFFLINLSSWFLIPR